MGSGTPPARWGLLVAACCLALLALGPVYDTNDDPAMIALLSGAGGGAAFEPTYLGSPLSAALLNLYAALPAIPWYGLVMESCNVASAALWAALIASCPIRTTLRLAATAGLLVGYGYLVLRVNFMATSLSLFLAGTAWLWKLQIERRPLRWRQGWLGAALGLGYMIRPSLQLLLLFFALPCLVVSLGARNLRRLLLVGVPAAALILATVAGDHLRLEAPGALALATFNKARSFLVDIPRDPTPAALAAAGWSRGDYEMAVRFGMYDGELYQAGRIRAFLAQAGRAPWVERYARTARAYLLGRFHLLCLATFLCVVWLLRTAPGGAGGANRPPAAARALLWAWFAAGTLALIANRFPPRVFVPLYLYLGALAILVPPPLPRFSRGRTVASLARPVALGTVAALLCFSMAFWLADARAGRARLEADSRELAAGAAAAGPEAILVPIGQLLETQYAGALTPGAFPASSLTAPAGWVVATPAFGDFLARAGFASGHAFMQGLARDRRMVFVVRRSRQDDARWLLERLSDAMRRVSGSGSNRWTLPPTARDSCSSGSASGPAKHGRRGTIPRPKVGGSSPELAVAPAWKVLCRESVFVKRHDSIDVLRAAAILLMVQIHFTQNLATDLAAGGLLAYGSRALGMIPAPLFTFLAGMSLRLSLSRDPGCGPAGEEFAVRHLRRGTLLIFAGLVFATLVRMPDQIFAWDILPFIGASLLVLFTLRRFSPGALALTALLVVVVSPPLRTLSDYAAHWPSGEHYLYSFTLRDVAWGFLVNGYFPLFPWLVFPLAGFLAARVFLLDGPDGRALRRLLPAAGLAFVALSAAGSAAGGRLGGVWQEYASPVRFYPATTTFVLKVLGLILCAFWALHGWLDRRAGARLPLLGFLRRYSRFSLTTYVVHHAVLLWPLLLAAHLGGFADPWHYSGAVTTTGTALILAVAFILLFAAVLAAWDRRGGA